MCVVAGWEGGLARKTCVTPFFTLISRVFMHDMLLHCTALHSWFKPGLSALSILDINNCILVD